MGVPFPFCNAVCFSIGALLLVTGDCNTFLGRGSTYPADRVSFEGVHESLLAEINDALGNNGLDSRIKQLEFEFQPMYQALPKNEYGNLGHAAVRYALHRYFVEKHGWHINGLEPSGHGWTNVWPTVILKDQVPTYIQELFEEQLAGRGFGLRELSVFCATLTHLVHDEARDHLRAAYRLHALPETSAISQGSVDKVLDTYMTFFLLGAGGNVTSMTEEEVAERRRRVSETFPGWAGTQAFVREVRRNVTEPEGVAAAALGMDFDFAVVERIVVEISQEIGHFQDRECKNVKSRLRGIGNRQTARIRLFEFYQAGLGGAVQFTESAEFLRNLGALDESDPQRASVIAPNYINAPSNCIARSNLYAVCCIDECELLLRHLERSIAAPSARPATIARLVEALPSATVDIPRKLPDALLGRLVEISDLHQGRVQLHSRLFSQWLHHAYPWECPYPQVPGTASPQSADQWMTETGLKSTLDAQDMEDYIEGAMEYEVTLYPDGASSAEPEDLLQLPWSMEDQLVVEKPPAAGPIAPTIRTQVQPIVVVRSLIFVATLVSMYSLVRGKAMLISRAVHEGGDCARKLLV